MLSELQKKDLQYNWHPYTQHQIAAAPIVIKKGKDALLWDEHDNEFIDVIGSWWANPHGHANRKIAKAISEQIHTLEHVLFGGFTHPKAIELSEKLVAILPHYQKVFYSDNGSTAVEVALKMALQYFLNKGVQKNTCIAFEDAFHGDTFGAMAASGISLFTEGYSDFFMPVERIPLPKEENWDEVKKRFTALIQSGDVYAFIFEPLVQGASGMRMYEAKYLDELMRIAQSYGVFCIADEVMTGFGRTGKLFATDYLSQRPDLICISKALTGGFIPMSATLATQEIFEAFQDQDVNKAFFHGHTFMANPAGCAAALSSLEITCSLETQKNIERIQAKYFEFKQNLKSFSYIKNLREKGVILAFEVDIQGDGDYYGELRNRMFTHFMEHHIVARPVGKTIYFLPMYCITDAQLDRVFEVTLDLLNTLE